MNQKKKALNVLGIIVSILLSVVLVLFLAVTPLSMSVLSILHPDALAEAVSKVDFENTVGALIAESGEALEDQQVKQLGVILSTNAGKELVKSYTQGVIDALGGKADAQGITKQMLQQLVSENKAELVQALRESGGDYAAMSDEELIDNIQKTVDENAQGILDILPDPQELKQELVGENPQMGTTLTLVAAAKTIKLILVGAAVVLCAIIFFCRFVDLRGIKWLGIDLLIAGLLSSVVSGSFNVINELLTGLSDGSTLVAGLVGAFVGKINSGLQVRTVILLAAAVALLASYIALCIYKKKKATAPQIPVAEQITENPEQGEIAELTE